ncbi:MAG: glycosyltransferase [Sumerlaeia bacterium]
MNPPPLRVLRVIYDLQTGGVQRMMLRMVPLLRDAGVAVEVACLKEEGDMASAFRDAGATVHMVPFRSRLDPVGLWRLRKLVQAGRFDIVHSHMHAANCAVNGAFVACKGGLRIVNGYHSQTPFSGPGQERSARLLSRAADALVAVSESVREPLLAAGLPAGKIALIHNGVEVPSEAAPPRDRPGGEAEPLRLLWAGRFVTAKRADLALRIVSAAQRAGVPVRLDLAGDGPKMGKMQRLVAELAIEDAVTFHGWQTDIRPLIRAADFYLSSSEREGFPNTLLEVCAQGRGSLVCDIPPNREVFGGEGNGGYVLPDDVEAWVPVLRGLQAAPEKIAEAGRAAFARARLFSVEESVRKTVELYGRG